MLFTHSQSNDFKDLPMTIPLKRKCSKTNTKIIRLNLKANSVTMQEIENA